MQPNSDGTVAPALAEGWKWEPNGLRLRIRLRPRVFTHDGQPLTPAIVADALRRASGTPSNWELYSSLKEIDRIDTTDENEITVLLKRPTVSLPEHLGVPLTFGVADEGTGPYRLAQRNGEEIVLERFERYYRGLPTIGAITIRPFTTPRTAWTSLLRGEIDMVTIVPADAVEFLSNDRIAVVAYPRDYEYVVGFNSARAPFRSPAVRRALNSAVDRERLVARVLGGRGLPATGPLWPQHWAMEKSDPRPQFDPRSAESTLDAAGFPLKKGPEGKRRSRFSFTCLVPLNFRTEERLALEIQKDLFDIGVDVRFEALPPDVFFQRILTGNFDAVLTEMNGGPTLSRPFMFWRSARKFKGLYNTYGYENAEAERLFALLEETTNEATVRSTARQLRDVFANDPPALFLAWSEGASAVSRSFQIVQESGRNPALSLWRWTPNATAGTNQ